MRPPPRIRKTVKWGGAAVTVLLVVVWIGSGWKSAYWIDDKGHSVSVTSDGPAVAWGVIEYPGTPLGFRLERSRRRSYPFGLFRAEPAHQDGVVLVPHWIAVGISFAMAAAAWRLDILARHRRPRLNLCPNCNYDRAGLAGGAGAVCPECGKLPA